MFFNFFIFYFPTELIVLLITLALFNINLKLQYKIILPFCHTIFLFYILNNLTSPKLTLIISLTFTILIIKILFKADLLLIILLTVVTYSIYIPLEYIIFTLNLILFNNSFREIFSSPGKTLLAVFPLFLILLIILLLIKRFNFSLINNKIEIIIKNRKNRGIIWATLIIAIEHFVLIFHLGWKYILKQKEGFSLPSFLLVAFITFSILIFIIYRLFETLKDEINLMTAKEELDNLSKLIFTLKTQQHDFKHHLQLLMSLIQMRKYDKTLKYIKGVTEELQEISEVSNSGIPALDGLLQYKITLAKRYGIELQIKIASKLDRLPLSESKICRVIGNLVSNAVEYLKDKQQIERYIQLLIYETRDKYIINTANPVQEEEVFKKGVNKLLVPGITSKGEGHGLGLAIVNDIITGAGGKIKPELDRDERILSFKITLPKSGMIDIG